MDSRPIGIFDSGVGGLTVCKAVSSLLPSEDIIYFGDTMRFPYGTRSIETIVNYSREISAYLLSRDVKMIIIACNTASAASLNILRKELNIPIMGVIEAGAKAACHKLNGDKIGIIATRATVASQSYVREIQKIKPATTVLQQQASIFVSLTEEGWINDEITLLTAQKYIQPLYDQGVRTLILGCTHFPLLKTAINRVYPDLLLIDTGEEIAHEAQALLQEKSLENKKQKGDIEFYASDLTETMERVKKLFFNDQNVEIKKMIISGK